MPVTPENAAHLAAKRLETVLVEMLERGEFGEVAIIITPAGLQPVKRVETEYRTIKLAIGNSFITSS